MYNIFQDHVMCGIQLQSSLYDFQGIIMIFFFLQDDDDTLPGLQEPQAMQRTVSPHSSHSPAPDVLGRSRVFFILSLLQSFAKKITVTMCRVHKFLPVQLLLSIVIFFFLILEFAPFIVYQGCQNSLLTPI